MSLINAFPQVSAIGISGGYAPVGTIIAYMGVTAPTDYLICDGATYNIADYKQLADHITSNFGSVNYFGGDGSTTFAVPDLRGEFLRGTGTNSHENQGSGADVGIHQNATKVLDMYVYSPDGKLSQLCYTCPPEMTRIDAGPFDYNAATSERFYFSNGSNTSSISERPIGGTVRPTNTSVLYCIKYTAAGETYSKDERVVGTWLDGKPIYQKSWTLDRLLPGDSSSLSVSDLGIAALRIETVICIDALMYEIDNKGWTSTTSGGGKGLVLLNTSTLYFSQDWTGGANKYRLKSVTIRYTKTTD